MKNFNITKSLVGEYLEEDELKYVDCYVHNKLGLFIPSTEHCGYALQKNHAHPSYMIIIVFFQEDLGFNPKIEIKNKHYYAEIMSPDIPHNEISEKFSRYYCIMIDKKYFEEQYLLYSNDLPEFTGHQFSVCCDILKALNTFAFESSKSMKNSDITLDAQATLITHWIIRSILGENIDMRSVSSNYSVGRVQQYIEQHFNEKITVKDLAQTAYMSESSLNRLFKKETSFTPIEYLIETRIAKSKTLLRRKDIRITEIAARCGFSSNAHFTLCFKNIVHMSPSEFRELYHE